MIILFLKQRGRAKIMIHNLSLSIVRIFYNELLIEKDEINVCCYGLEMIISTFIGLSIVLIIGYIFDYIIFSLFYLIFIVPIRMCTGGYHAKSYFTCNIVFSLFYVLAIFLYINIKDEQSIIFAYINLFSIPLIVKLAPLENKNKLLKEKIKRRCRNMSIAIYVISVLLSILFKDIYFINILSIVLIMVTIMLILGKVVSLYEKHFI